MENPEFRLALFERKAKAMFKNMADGRSCKDGVSECVISQLLNHIRDRTGVQPDFVDTLLPLPKNLLYEITENIYTNGKLNFGKNRALS